MAVHLRIRLDDLRDPRIAAFLEEHLADMRRVSPPESVHALDLDGLRRPEIRFWSAWTADASGEALHKGYLSKEEAKAFARACRPAVMAPGGAA